jgi:hypothetical protein
LGEFCVQFPPSNFFLVLSTIWFMVLISDVAQIVQLISWFGVYLPGVFACLCQKYIPAATSEVQSQIE